MRWLMVVMVAGLAGCMTPCELGQDDARVAYVEDGCDAWWDTEHCTESDGTRAGDDREACCWGYLDLELCPDD